MGSVTPPYLNYTGGEIGRAMENRVDVETYPFSGSLYKNCWPIAQGPLTRSPGTKFIDEFFLSASRGELNSFEFSDTETYLIVCRDLEWQILLDDVLLSTTAVTGAFTGSWSDTSESPAYIVETAGEIEFDSDGSVEARAQRAMTINETGEIHILVFDVENGPIDLHIGSSSGDNDVVSYTELRTGKHYIAFTPNVGTVYVQFAHQKTGIKRVDNIALSSGGTLSIAVPYLQADIPDLQTRQTGDTKYIAHEAYFPRRLERRGHYSWSIVLFEPDNGPFIDANLSTTSLQPSAATGQINMTASKPYWTSDHLRNIYEITHHGQYTVRTAARADIETGTIKVVGAIAADRTVDFLVSGTFTATVTLQKSYNNKTDWQDVSTYSAPTSGTVTDNATNTTVYYRMVVGTGDYTSGSVQMELTADHGSQAGFVRILEITSDTVAVAEVLQELGDLDATTVYRRSAWRPDTGYPGSVSFGFGRLWWGGGFRIFASASDDFPNMLDDAEDDSSAFSASISDTPGGIRWIGFIQHLCIGTRDREFIGLPANPSQAVSGNNFQLLPQTHSGSAAIQPGIADNSIVFAQKGGSRLLQFIQDPKALSDQVYTAVDINRLHPESVRAGIRRIQIQHQPERRIWVLLNDGTVRVNLFRREEGIAAWSRYILDGVIEDIRVIRNTRQDDVYFVVRRKVNGSVVRFIEKALPDPTLVLVDEQRYHLQACVESSIIDLDTSIISISGLTGTITIETLDANFVAGHVGKILWVNGGRGTIASVPSSSTCTVNVVYALESDDPVGPGSWFIGTSATVVSGLDHWEGEDVYGWADRKEVGPLTVSGGSVTLPFSASVYALGQRMEMRYRSGKLAWGGDKGTAVTKHKSTHEYGLIVHESSEHAMIGESFDDARMKKILFRFDDGETYDEGMPLFTGEILDSMDSDGSSTDPRYCIKTNGAGPFTLAGYIPHIETYDYA